MSSAAQQRMRRTRCPEQMALALDIPATLQLTDPAARLREQGDFAVIAGDIARAQAQAPDPWADSPYAWFKRLPPARRATTGHGLLARWLTHCGVSHSSRHGSGDFDLTVDAARGPVRVQVRVSTLWAEGDFVFQGVRAGDFDALALLAIAPHEVCLWVVPQGLALANREQSGWLSVPASRTPAWLAPFGGSLTEATRQLAA